MSKVLEKRIKEYKHVLYSFFNQYGICDQEERDSYQSKFYSLLNNYRKMDGIKIEKYLKKGLTKIKKHYWSDKLKKNKIDMKYYSQLSETEKKEWDIALAIDSISGDGEVVTDKKHIKIILFIECLKDREKRFIYLLFYKKLNIREISKEMGSSLDNMYRLWERIKYKHINNDILIDFPNNKISLVKTGNKKPVKGMPPKDKPIKIRKPVKVNVEDLTDNQKEEHYVSEYLKKSL